MLFLNLQEQEPNKKSLLVLCYFSIYTVSLTAPNSGLWVDKICPCPLSSIIFSQGHSLANCL